MSQHLSQFLALREYPVDRAKLILRKYGNLVFSNQTEFDDWARKNNIEIPARKKEEFRILKEADIEYDLALKDLINQSELRQLRNFISRQIQIKKLLEGGTDLSNIDTLDELQTSLLQETEHGIDDFQKNIVRKLLSGGEDGKLPSEMLQELIDLSTVVKEDDDSGWEPLEMTRDQSGRVISYYTDSKNLKKRVKIHPNSIRFNLNKFNFTVDSLFKDPSFVSEIASSRLGNAGVQDPTTQRLIGLIPDLIASSEKDSMISDLKNKVREFSSQAESYRTQVEALKINYDELQGQMSQTMATADAFKNLYDKSSEDFTKNIASVTDNVTNAIKSSQDQVQKIQDAADKQNKQLGDVLNGIGDTITKLLNNINTSKTGGTSGTSSTKGTGGSGGVGTTAGRGGAQGLADLGDVASQLEQMRTQIFSIKEQTQNAINDGINNIAGSNDSQIQSLQDSIGFMQSVNNLNSNATNQNVDNLNQQLNDVSSNSEFNDGIASISMLAIGSGIDDIKTAVGNVQAKFEQVKESETVNGINILAGISNRLLDDVNTLQDKIAGIETSLSTILNTVSEQQNTKPKYIIR